MGGGDGQVPVTAVGDESSGMWDRTDNLFAGMFGRPEEREALG